ncbi:MAG: phage tail tape measure protein [Planctomycetota bacterium]
MTDLGGLPPLEFRSDFSQIRRDLRSLQTDFRRVAREARETDLAIQRIRGGAVAGSLGGARGGATVAPTFIPGAIGGGRVGPRIGPAGAAVIGGGITSARIDTRQFDTALRQSALNIGRFTGALDGAISRLERIGAGGNGGGGRGPTVIPGGGRPGGGRSRVIGGTGALGAASGFARGLGFGGLATGGLLFGGAAGVADTIGESVSFERQLAVVQGVSGASAEEIAALRDEIQRSAPAVRAGVTDAAQGLEQLSRAGLDLASATEAIGPSLQFARANAVDFGEAADVATNVVAQFGLQTSDLPRVFDAITFAANDANTTVSQISQALREAGPIARASGVDLEEVLGILQALAQGGIRGNVAGTRLRSIFVQLASEARELRPEVVGIDGLLAELESRQLSLADAASLVQRRNAGALLTIANNRDAIVQNIRDLERAEGTVRNLDAIVADTATGAFQALGAEASSFQVQLDESLGISQLLEESARRLGGLFRGAAEGLRILREDGEVSQPITSARRLSLLDEESARNANQRDLIDRFSGLQVQSQPNLTRELIDFGRTQVFRRSQTRRSIEEFLNPELGGSFALDLALQRELRTPEDGFANDRARDRAIAEAQRIIEGNISGDRNNPAALDVQQQAAIRQAFGDRSLTDRLLSQFDIPVEELNRTLEDLNISGATLARRLREVSGGDGLLSLDEFSRDLTFQTLTQGRPAFIGENGPLPFSANGTPIRRRGDTEIPLVGQEFEAFTDLPFGPRPGFNTRAVEGEFVRTQVPATQRSRTSQRGFTFGDVQRRLDQELRIAEVGPGIRGQAISTLQGFDLEGTPGQIDRVSDSLERLQSLDNLSGFADELSGSFGNLFATLAQGGDAGDALAAFVAQLSSAATNLLLFSPGALFGAGGFLASNIFSGLSSPTSAITPTGPGIGAIATTPGPANGVLTGVTNGLNASSAVAGQTVNNNTFNVGTLSARDLAAAQSGTSQRQQLTRSGAIPRR